MRAALVPRSGRRLLATAVVAVSLLAACGTSGGSDAGDDPTTTTTEATNTTAGDAATADVVEADDETDARDYRGEIGKQVTFDCPAGGSPATIWGAELYTDDSSVCTAAVHVGLITFAEGGEVTIQMARGVSSYRSGVANGVSSTSYGPWDGSFSFPDIELGSARFEPSLESWGITAAGQGLEVGETFEVACTPGGEGRSVWGTDTYTADSSICTAAVHSGLITLEDGGTVTIEVTDGEDSYESSEANGIETESYGSYATSFVFPTS